MPQKQIYNIVLVGLFLAMGCGSSSRTAKTVGLPEVEGADVRANDEGSSTPEGRMESTDASEVSEDGIAADWYQQDAEEGVYPGVSSRRAYREALAGKTPARRVVVAVIDSGVDIHHEDISANLWVNEDEIPGNGTDDDGNGYADDVNGWNFIGGADGRNVHYDTYEVTRELARLTTKYDGVSPDVLGASDRRAFDYYLAVRKDFDKKRSGLKENLANLENASRAVRAARSIISGELRTDDFTIAQVRNLQSEKEMVKQAQDILIYLDDLGISEEELVEEQDDIAARLTYGFNLKHDPRDIVGDDYADLSQRRYGNADVVGPDPFHGTHVAGIVAAVRGNGTGIDGIADNTEIMVIRAVPDGDERDKDVANAIRYAVDNGAHVINMSFGKDYSPHKASVDAAIRYADRAGVLIVHGAGNDGENIDEKSNFPSRYSGEAEASNWIEVGASSWSSGEELAAGFSNYGSDGVDVFAPGVSIYSTTPGHSYDRADGTSMAAPVVSGIAALLMAYYPNLSARQVRDIVIQSATSHVGVPVTRPGSEDETTVDFGRLSRSGGVVNAYRAVRLAEQLSR